MTAGRHGVSGSIDAWGGDAMQGLASASVLALSLLLVFAAEAEAAPGDVLYTHRGRLVSAGDGARHHRGRLVSAGDGARLNMYCLGRGTPAVVFDCGFEDWAPAWAVVQPRIARSEER